MFIAPLWPEIYCNDAERRQSLDEARRTHGALVDAYTRYGYTLIELPFTGPQGRLQFVLRHANLAPPPDDVELKQAYDRLRELHGQAFGRRPPDVAGLERLGATRMRQYVRAWINEWDLMRLDPGYRPETEMVDMPTDYRVDPDLERSEPE